MITKTLAFKLLSYWVTINTLPTLKSENWAGITAKRLHFYSKGYLYNTVPHYYLQMYKWYLLYFFCSTFIFFQFVTDLLFIAPAYLAAEELYRLGTRVFLYEWSYISDSAMSGFPWKGAFHASELEYLFDAPEPLFGNFPHDSRTKDQEVKDLLADLWTNFARSG